MKNKVLLLVGLLAVLLFVVSCAPTKKLTDEEMVKEASELSKEELAAASAENGAVAGQAVKSSSVSKSNSVNLLRNSGFKDAAKNPGNFCTDTDGSLPQPQFVKGNVNYKFGSATGLQTDSCISSDVVREWSCAEGVYIPMGSSAVCPYGCSDGKCNVAGCGDWKTQPWLGEACDDGNKVAGDGCSSSCTVESGWKCDLTVKFADGSLESKCQPVGQPAGNSTQ